MMTYKDLDVWQKSMLLVTEVYRLTASFPSEERYSLTSQIKRSAVSIPSNISEGFARRNPKENAQFINIAFGSATELETQLIIAKNLGFCGSIETVDSLLKDVLSMLFRYRQSVQNQSKNFV